MYLDKINKEFNKLQIVSSFIADEAQITLDLLDGNIIPYKNMGLSNYDGFDFFAITSPCFEYYDSIRDGFLNNLAQMYYHDYFVVSQSLFYFLQYYNGRSCHEKIIEEMHHENEKIDESLERILNRDSYERNLFIRDVVYYRELFFDHIEDIKRIQKLLLKT